MRTHTYEAHARARRVNGQYNYTLLAQFKQGLGCRPNTLTK